MVIAKVIKKVIEMEIFKRLSRNASGEIGELKELWKWELGGIPIGRYSIVLLIFWLIGSIVPILISIWINHDQENFIGRN